MIVGWTAGDAPGAGRFLGFAAAGGMSVRIGEGDGIRGR